MRVRVDVIALISRLCRSVDRRVVVTCDLYVLNNSRGVDLVRDLIDGLDLAGAEKSRTLCVYVNVQIKLSDVRGDGYITSLDFRLCLFVLLLMTALLFDKYHFLVILQLQIFLHFLLLHLIALLPFQHHQIFDNNLLYFQQT